MNGSVFLAPCDAGNFDQTVLSAINVNDFPNRPEELSELEQVRFWGARKGSRNEEYFERMDSGDLILFYQDGTYVGTGWVGITFEDDDQWASETFWNNAPSELIYTIKGFTSVSVPKAAVNRIFDYAEGYYPQGLTRVTEKRRDRRPEVVKRAVEKYTEKHR